MLDNLKDKLIHELKDVSKDGVKTGNIEYLSKLAETYKNLNKAEKEELETMMYDERMNRGLDLDRRYGAERYQDNRDQLYGDYDGRGRGSFARRDSRGRYADGMRPVEEFYNDYMGAKRRYRAGESGTAAMSDGLDMMMKHISMLIEDIYKECDSEDEKRIMDKYIKRIADIR